MIAIFIHFDNNGPPEAFLIGPEAGDKAEVGSNSCNDLVTFCHRRDQCDGWPEPHELRVTIRCQWAQWSSPGENIPILDSSVTVTILYLLAAVRNPIWVSDGGSSDMPGGAQQIFYSKRKRSTLETNIGRYWEWNLYEVSEKSLNQRLGAIKMIYLAPSWIFPVYIIARNQIYK